MINTYLNDNQSMPYPFYGYGALPFPMCVITGMGVCIHMHKGEEFPTGYNRIYACSISIADTSVTVALCRKPSTGGVELVGILYARTDGYSMYVPSYTDAAVYGNQSISPAMLRYVYAGEAVEVDDQEVASDLQVFYSRTRETFDTVLSTTSSTGFIQLGPIPQSAIGNYQGEFYLDPSCVTYLDDDTYGHYSHYTVGPNKYSIGQRFDIELSGLLVWQDQQITTKYQTDTNDFVVLDDQYAQKVDKINGVAIEGSTAAAYPTLVLAGHTNYVELSAAPSVEGSTASAVVVTINGTTEFPNCYKD